VVVPSYQRHEILVATLDRLAALTPPPNEIIVVDQTPSHPAAVAAALDRLASKGTIRRLMRAQPSIPGAMNDGLRAATGDIVLFCDDDVEPAFDWVGAHLAAHEGSPCTVVAGQVLQPGEVAAPLAGPAFAFRSSVRQTIDQVMGGNFSAPRSFLLAIGGFDEGFVGAAYLFERELSDRAIAGGARILFEPGASLRHLRADSGGTRAWGDHLRSARPGHSVGEYYYWLQATGRAGRWRQILRRPLLAVRTRHHLRRPWWIPVTLVAELLGFCWALRLAARRRHRLVTAGVSL
jgi:GT2 family glycosyltransferase